MEDLRKVQTPEEEISGKEETEASSSLEKFETDKIEGDKVLGGGGGFTIIPGKKGGGGQTGGNG